MKNYACMLKCIINYRIKKKKLNKVIEKKCFIQKKILTKQKKQEKNNQKLRIDKKITYLW